MLYIIEGSYMYYFRFYFYTHETYLQYIDAYSSMQIVNSYYSPDVFWAITSQSFCPYCFLLISIKLLWFSHSSLSINPNHLAHNGEEMTNNITSILTKLFPCCQFTKLLTNFPSSRLPFNAHFHWIYTFLVSLVSPVSASYQIEV